MKVVRNAVFGLALGLGLLVSTSVRADVVKGELDDDNPERVYKVTLKPKTKYLFYLTSGDFDTYLYLMNAEGEVLSKNDDLAKSSGTKIPTLDSRIITITTEGGTYQVKASSLLKKGRGEFQLFAGTPRSGPSNEKGKLTKRSPKFENRLPYASVNMKLEKGVAYKFTATSSDFDALLGVRMKGAAKMLATDDNSGGRTNSLLYYLPTKTGEYEVLIGSLNQAFGEYEFTAQAYKGNGTELKK
ncbi:MAG: hypothetical protein ACFCD0_15015 [Gemmataceae bacterium]